MSDTPASAPMSDYDAILVVGFGGPEKPDDVMPFLENVLRGRNVPRERMLEVAEHYHHFGGVSPINAQVRDLIAALEPALADAGVKLPIYWGNRNWHPLLPDTLRTMKQAGVRSSIALVLAAYSSYSSCRQYREDLARAREAVGEEAPGSTRSGSFTTIPGSSPPASSGSTRPWRRSRKGVATRSTSRSRPTAFPAPWRRTADTRNSFRKRADWSGYRREFPPNAGAWSTRAGAADRPTLGSNRISTIISGVWPGAAYMR